MAYQHPLLEKIPRGAVHPLVRCRQFTHNRPWHPYERRTLLKRRHEHALLSGGVLLAEQRFLCIGRVTGRQRETRLALAAERDVCSGLMIPDTDLGENTGHEEVSDGVTVDANEQVVSQTTDVASEPTAVAKGAVSAEHAVPAPAETVNVQCTNDGTYFGANVCNSAILAAAYQLELTEYEAAQVRLGGKDIGVSAEQQNWLDTVTKTCSDMECLTTAFDARVADLHARYRKNG